MSFNGCVTISVRNSSGTYEVNQIQPKSLYALPTRQALALDP